MDITCKFDYENCFAVNLVKDLKLQIKLLKKEYVANYLQETLFIYSEEEQLLKKVLPYLKERGKLNNISLITENNKSIVIKVTTDQCPLLFTFKNMDYTNKKSLIERINNDGEIEWSMEVESFSNLNYISDILNQKFNIKNVKTKINKIKRQDPKSEYILHEAYELGYFDIPKRLGLEELSIILHIPPTTLDLLLRDSIKNLLKKNYVKY